jgi:lipoprotein signal peptidase
VFYLFVAAGVFLLLDQWSKSVVQARVRGGCVFWGPVLRIRGVRSVKNLYQHEKSRVLLVLLWLVALGSAFLLYRSGIWFQSRVALLALGAAFGGAAGNLLDVLRRRYVFDFIDLRWWPVFNLADVAIVAGLATAFLRPA